MGILGLSRLIADLAPEAIREVDLGSLFGRRLAIDASMSIYQFLIAIRNRDQLMTNESGETTSHLIGLFYRTIKLLELGIKPIYVFDGKAPQLKCGELLKRAERRAEAETKLAEAREHQDLENINKFNKRLVRVTKEHNNDCKKLLRLLGLPIIESPAEAEAQCAQLCKEGLVYATATEDMDGLTFGSLRLVRNLTVSSNNDKVKEYYLDKVLSGLGINHSQFIDLGILMGCDYCESIKGVGGRKGLDLIKKYGSIEQILEQIFGITEFFNVEVDYGERKDVKEEVELNGDENKEIESEATQVSQPTNGSQSADGSQAVDEIQSNEDSAEELSDEEIKTKNDKKSKKKPKSKGKKGMIVPENWLFIGARKLFVEPNVLKNEIKESDLKQKEIDEEGIIQFLCTENGFGEERVKNAIKRVKEAKGKCSQTRIDSFFKTMPNTNNSSKVVKKNDNKRSAPQSKKSGNKRGRKPK